MASGHQKRISGDLDKALASFSDDPEYKRAHCTGDQDRSAVGIVEFPGQVRHFGTQIVGFGPAALGVFVAADRISLLDDLLDAGVLVLEEQPSLEQMTRKLYPWRIQTNSAGQDFVEGLGRAGRYHRLFDDPIVAALTVSTNIVQMSMVRHFTAVLAEATWHELVESGNRPQFGVNVHMIEQLPDGGFLTRDASGWPLASSDTVVLAAGATEVLKALADGPVIPSGRFLQSELGETVPVLRSGRPIRIVGDSHSAFSVADLLTRELGTGMRSGQGQILIRRVRRFFPDVDAARKAGEAFSNGDICPETGNVNRFAGLRGDALAAYERILSGQDRRFMLVQSGADLSRVQRPAITIHASGYSARAVRITRPAGEPMVLRSADGGPETDSRCQVIGVDGQRVPGLYALGLGHSPGAPGGQRRASVNFFHGVDAARLVSSLLVRVGVQRASAHRTAAPTKMIGESS